jgi:ornithine lipid ester-linked acyl 2-hydroxylase
MKAGNSSPNKKRPLVIRIGKKIRPFVNKVIAAGSLVPNSPVLDPYIMPWVRSLEENWQEVQKEFLAVLGGQQDIPSLRDISPDHSVIARDPRWKTFFLYGYGYKVPENCARAPFTAALVSKIPNLNSAFFSILEPGCRIPPHDGVTKGLMTCHLGLFVPKEKEKCWIQVADKRLKWDEGKCILFDDTYLHEVENETESVRGILLIQIERPCRGVGKFMQRLFLDAVKHSPFVQEARRNIGQWSEAFQQTERA